MKKNIEMLDEIVVELNKSIDEKNTAFDILNEANFDLSQDLKQAQTRIIQLEETLQEANSTNSTNQLENSALSNDCEVYRETIDILQVKLASVSEQYAVAVQDKQYLEKSLDSALKSLSCEENTRLKSKQDELDVLKGIVIEKDGLILQMVYLINVE